MVRQIRLFVDDAFFARITRLKTARKWTWEEFLRQAVRVLEKEQVEDKEKS